MYVITNPEIPTLKTYVLLGRATAKNSKKNMLMRILRKGLFLVIGAAMLYEGYDCTRYLINTGLGGVFLPIAAFAIAAFALAWFFLYDVIIARKALYDVEKSGGEGGTIRFDAENVHIRSSKISSDISYLGVQSIWCSGSCYFLFISEYRALIADTAYLTEGNPEEFRSFLEEKTGISIKSI